MRRILGHYVATSWVLFGLLEASLLAVASGVAFVYAFHDLDFSPAQLSGFAIVLSFGIVALMHSGGLYQLSAIRDFRRTFRRVAAISVPILFLAVWTTGELAKRTGVPIDPYRWQWTGVLAAGWIASALFLRLVLREVYRSGVLTRKIVLIGTATQALELAGLTGDADERFQVVGRIDPWFVLSDREDPESVERLAVATNASEIVVAIGGNPSPWQELVRCRLSGIRITDYLDFYEREARRLQIESLRDDWIALSKGFRTTKSAESRRRVVDIILAIAGFVASGPVLLLTALAIKLEDGGPVFYRQERIGQHGLPFTLLKFRSMHDGAEREGMPAWASERDSRITNVGRVIRMFRVDELPQLWNVLRGDMALIGPRPERPYFVQQFSHCIPYYDCRHAIRPGITGWAQVSFRYGASMDDTRTKLSYDLYYIKNRGILLDLLILLRTLGVVLSRQGAR